MILDKFPLPELIVDTRAGFGETLELSGTPQILGLMQAGRYCRRSDAIRYLLVLLNYRECLFKARICLHKCRFDIRLHDHVSIRDLPVYYILQILMNFLDNF